MKFLLKYSLLTMESFSLKGPCLFFSSSVFLVPIFTSVFIWLGNGKDSRCMEAPWNSSRKRHGAPSVSRLFPQWKAGRSYPGWRLGRSNSDSDTGFVAGREWSQQPHIPREGNCSVPEGGEQGFGKRERSRPGQKLESQNPENEIKEDQNLRN